VSSCLLIPIYDHGGTIRAVVESLAPYGLPCIVVDDGSGEETRRVLDALGSDLPWVEVHHHKENRGKGAALQTGYRLAGRRGFSHVIQLDADGQHAAADVPAFGAAIDRFPDALVLGEPCFDASIPRSRLYGRQLSRGIVWALTLSGVVRDPLCGFRAIPLVPTLALMDRVRMGDHMEFDPELAIRLVWEGVPVVSVPTPVVYREGGISHFDVVWDDLRLAGLYARLTAGLVPRAAGLLARRVRERR
jgi:glycosyltransferase involved in cell wall biosynthesis